MRLPCCGPAPEADFVCVCMCVCIFIAQDAVCRRFELIAEASWSHIMTSGMDCMVAQQKRALYASGASQSISPTCPNSFLSQTSTAGAKMQFK